MPPVRSFVEVHVHYFNRSGSVSAEPCGMGASHACSIGHPVARFDIFSRVKSHELSFNYFKLSPFRSICITIAWAWAINSNEHTHRIRQCDGHLNSIWFRPWILYATHAMRDDLKKRYLKTVKRFRLVDWRGYEWTIHEILLTFSWMADWIVKSKMNAKN